MGPSDAVASCVPVLEAATLSLRVGDGCDSEKVGRTETDTVRVSEVVAATLRVGLGCAVTLGGTAAVAVRDEDADALADISRVLLVDADADSSSE